MPAAKTSKRKTPIKKQKKITKVSTARSVFNTLTSNKLLLFVVSFGVMGAAFVMYSSAATQPSIYFDATNCRIYGRSGWYKPATAQLSGPNLRTVSARVSTPNGSYSLPTRNTAGKTVYVKNAKVVFRNYGDGKVYFTKYFNISNFSSRCR